MKHVRIAIIVLSFVGAAVVAGAFYWVLPKTALVHVAGTEIKRSTGNATHDVRFVQTADVDDGTPRVFRNEDTRWGNFHAVHEVQFPADLSARAADIARSEPQSTVLITYYGVRSHVLDWYPNVIRLEIVAADYAHIPIFNIAFLVVFWGIDHFYLYVRARRGVRQTRRAVSASRKRLLPDFAVHGTRR